MKSMTVLKVLVKAIDTCEILPSGVVLVSLSFRDNDMRLISRLFLVDRQINVAKHFSYLERRRISSSRLFLLGKR